MLKDINLIGIAGAGTMGSGIAQIFSRFGKTVIVNDIKEENSLPFFTLQYLNIDSCKD